jgi:hypothetical protein
VDAVSDEHEGEGGYLEWHDEMVPKMGGNEWAAWAKPKASRKKLISGLLHIKTPLIFTFRAREKTKQNPDARSAKDKIVNIGWQPVAPLEIVHTLDLTCILPPRAEWRAGLEVRQDRRGLHHQAAELSRALHQGRPADVRGHGRGVREVGEGRHRSIGHALAS